MKDRDTSQRGGREYPSAPLVGVAGVVVCGGKVLLIQRGQEPLLGAWSLPGGLLEVGETLSEGVAREIWEETGLRVRPVEMVATVDRIVRDSEEQVQYHYVLVDWFCMVDSEKRELVCGDDAAAARWVQRDEIYSEVYSLGATTLAVIEKALELAEKLEL